MIEPIPSAVSRKTPSSEAERRPVLQSPVSRRRRVLGWTIDYLMSITVMAALAVFGLLELTHSLPAFVGAVASDAGWNSLKLVAHGGHGLSGELGEAAGHEWLTLVMPLLLSLTAAAVFQFVYQTVMLSWRGCTLGKIAAGTRVRQHPTGVRLTTRQAMTRALITTGTETGLLAIACVLLTLGHFLLSVVVWAIAVTAFWANVVVAVRGRNRTLADHVAGTVVIRTRIRPRPVPAAPPAPATGAAFDHGGYTEAEPAGNAVTATPTHHGTPAQHRAPALEHSRVLGTAGFKRARRLAQKAQEIGSAGADRTYQIGQQAIGAVRADRGNPVPPRTRQIDDDELDSPVEQRVRRSWDTSRQQTPPTDTDLPPQSVLGLQQASGPQPAYWRDPPAGASERGQHPADGDPDNTTDR